MKTLLQINVLANSGSTGRIAEQIGLTAQASGWRSVIAYSRGNVTSSSELYRIDGKLSQAIHLASTRLFDRHGLASKIATRKLVRYIKELKPDVIHLHNIHGYFINYPIFFEYLKTSGIPVVWTLHDCWTFTGHCAYFDWAECGKWTSGCSDCPQTGAYPKSFWRDRSSKNYKQKKEHFTSVDKLTLVPVSEWLSGFLAKSFMKDKDKVTIHNGIDTDRYSPVEAYEAVLAKYGLRGNTMVLGVANIWEPRKGLPDFVKLRKALPEEYEIALVGLSQAQIADLPKGITGIERTENVNELAALYTAATVLFNPTYEDNFPTVNIEAMSCGTPVVTYDTGGSPEAVTPESGAVVPKGDIRKAVEEIEKICANGKEYYSHKCRTHITENFEMNSKYKEYIEIYNNII